MVTPPLPLPESSRLAFEELAEISLSCIVTPSTTTDSVAVTVVKVPATAVVPPITVLSIVPPSMSAHSCCYLIVCDVYI